MKTKLLLPAMFFAVMGGEMKAQPIYCTTNLNTANSCASGCGFIDTVAIAGTTLQNNGTGCSSVNAYTAYPAAGSTTATLARSSSYTLHVTNLSSFSGINNDISAWIDFNQNGVFDPSEWFDLGRNIPGGGINVQLKSFTVPANAALGLTGMRIRNRYSGGNDSIDACTNFGSGETEDYTVTIVGATGIENIDAVSGSLFVFPNPAKDYLKINFTSEKTKTLSVRLLGINGQVLYSNQITNFSGEYSKTIGIAHFAKGVYFLQVITDQSMMTKRVVID